MKSLTQKKFFNTSFFEMRDRSLFVSIKSFSEGFEEEILYENISNRVIKLTKKEPFLAIIGSGFGIAGILSLLKGSLEGFAILIAIGFVFAVLMKLMMKNVIQIYLHDGKAIILRADSPDEATVEQFLETLKANKRDYLISKYANIDKDLPVENQLNNLIWLKNEDYLTENEFQEYKNKLLGRDNENKIGF